MDSNKPTGLDCVGCPADAAHNSHCEAEHLSPNSVDHASGPHCRMSITAFSRRSSISTIREPCPPEPAHMRKDSASSTVDNKAFLSITPARPSLSRITSAHSTSSSGISVVECSLPSELVEMYQGLEPGVCEDVTSTETMDCEKEGFQSDIQEKANSNATASFGLNLCQVGQFSNVIADARMLDSLVANYPLREPIGTDESWNQLRFGFLSAYRRLFTLALAINLTVLIICIALYATAPGEHFDYSKAATAAGANLLMTALMRHEHCINILFKLVCLLPHSTPLFVRRHAAKVYCYGGLHSGCGVSAAFWYVFYTVLVAKDLESTVAEEVVVASSTGVALCALILIIIMAHPYIRARWHNQWELCHRYGAWTAILMVWVQTITIAVSSARVARIPTGSYIIEIPTFWFLCVISICLVYPWIRMRKVKVEAEPLSSHAIRLHFNHRTLPYCVGTRLTDDPMKETHGFATIANANGGKGFSCLVSNGGDWTKRIINNPPEHLWIRGAPTLGVMRVASMFKPVVVVATGSGIGPCLSFLNVRPDYPLRVIWSARFPESTYGSKIMQTVLEADNNAIIIDTKRTGHPNLLQLTWALVQESKSEAVVIISNPKVTRQVVYGLETRGIPAFGAVFDS